jgi:MarR family transcriptional regulator, organic hydroperoxide resistance regulator
MSISSKTRRRRAALNVVGEAVDWRLPATASRISLQQRGSDKRFRQLVSDLFTIAARMETVREHLARRMGLSGPQYSVLMAVARLQGRNGVAVGAVATQLHVSAAFIATETGKLQQIGLVAKRQSQKDRRSVLLSITRSGRLLIERHSEEIRVINDAFFGALSQRAFLGLSTAMAVLVHSSERVLTRLHGLPGSPSALREAAE